MDDYEPYLTLSELSNAIRYDWGPKTLRAFCNRTIHPLPHIRIGMKQSHVRVRLSAFLRWLEEEERLCINDAR